jgi:hypothetical protein
MAFPTVINADAYAGRGLAGPFISSSGNVYVIAEDDDQTDLRAFKGSDPATAFSAVGTDVVIGAGADQLWAIDGAQFGDEIHVVTKNGNVDGTSMDIRYHVFDMSSDTWTTSNTLIKSNITMNASPGRLASVGIKVRGDGAVFIAYNGARELVTAANYDRVFYARNLAGAWTADFALGTSGVAQDWVGGTIVLGGANRIHFFFQNATNGDTYQRTLNTSNALEPLPSSFEPSSEGFETHEQRGTYLSATDLVHFPVYSSANTVDGAQFTSSDVPSITINADITGAVNVLTSPYRYLASFAPHGNTVVNAFISDTNDIYTQTKIGGAAFGAPSLHRACSASSIYTNSYTRSSAFVLGMVYVDSGDVHYDELTLSTIGANAVLASRMGLLGVGI